jgi:uncharacterized protein YlxW (UPF0749 family)
VEVQPRTQPPAPRRGARPRWRLATFAVVLISGGMFVVSAQSSGGTDLRSSRYEDLATLTGKEAARAARLQQRVASLNAEVDQLSKQVDDDDVRRYQREVSALADPAGLTEREGPGVRVTLSDAPSEVVESSTGQKNLLVVHQQDIQAVVNAMWKGGATAVVIQGQRVVSTTGIKCEGNSVVLQGVPYPQPYVIEAIGDVGDLTSSIYADRYLQVYREQSDDPSIQIGWEADVEDSLDAPAYDGLLDLSYAKPLPTEETRGPSSDQQGEN